MLNKKGFLLAWKGNQFNNQLQIDGVSVEEEFNTTATTLGCIKKCTSFHISCNWLIIKAPRFDFVKYAVSLHIYCSWDFYYTVLNPGLEFQVELELWHTEIMCTNVIIWAVCSDVISGPCWFQNAWSDSNTCPPFPSCLNLVVLPPLLCLPTHLEWRDRHRQLELRALFMWNSTRTKNQEQHSGMVRARGPSVLSPAIVQASHPAPTQANLVYLKGLLCGCFLDPHRGESWGINEVNWYILLKMEGR